jgi:hypothetical protein
VGSRRHRRKYILFIQDLFSAFKQKTFKIIISISSASLLGCEKPKPVVTADLQLVIEHIGLSNIHDDKLFLAIHLIGFYGLLYPGELTIPDTVNLHDHQKLSLQHSLTTMPSQHSSFLLSHKADRFFKANTIIIQKIS